MGLVFIGDCDGTVELDNTAHVKPLFKKKRKVPYSKSSPNETVMYGPGSCMLARMEAQYWVLQAVPKEMEEVGLCGGLMVWATW